MERHISLIALTSALLFPSTYETKAQPPSEDFTLRSDVRKTKLTLKRQMGVRQIGEMNRIA